jgi:hypothetical protein
MTDKTKKIDKEYLLTDNSVNSYGFRLLTSGYLMDEYKKNPIGYFFHGKAADHPREQGVLVRWEDLRMDGDKVYGKPVINLNHPRGQKTVEEIESGFLNAASVGHLIVLDISTDAKDTLPGQTGPTVTKWFNRECSLVDIPGNFNALALYDKDENPIELANLADLFSKPKNYNMKKIELTAAQLAAINLSADADDAKFAQAFNDLVAKAKQVDALTAEKTTLQTELSNLKKEGVKKEVQDLIAKGVEGKKLTVEMGKKLEVTYAENPTGLKDLIDTMPAYQSVTEKITKEEDKNSKEYQDLAAKSGNDLLASGEMVKVKEKYPDLYKAKIEEIKKEANG